MIPETIGAPAAPSTEDGSINILMVDDEPKNLLSLETVLDNPAYRLIRATSADEALLALVAEEFALLILDIQMPGMNGFELAQLIKKRKKTAAVPIIFLTAYYSEDEHALEGYSTGAVDFLHKPINATVLRSKVAVFAELHRKTRESARAQEQLQAFNADLEQRVAQRTAELTESEAGYRALSEVLEAADKRKDEFLAMLGHELRNPLAAIRHAVRINGEADSDLATKQWASEVVDRQSAQLSRMVDDLLDVERINRGRIELRPESLDLTTVLERAVAAASPLLEERQHAFHKHLEPRTLPVRGDAARLEQIFVNLLSNASKYTPEGGLIQLIVRVEDRDVVVSISDNGVGIARDLLPNVFDLFTQAQTSLDRAQGGLGIGLTVVRSLTEMHGGRVSVESAGKSAGATFTVRLPLLDSPAAITRAEPVLGSLPCSLRVLIVDDHIDAAQTLARLLSRRNCEVRLAHDGPAGIVAAREFHPEVFLLDLGLPGLDGYELARTLRADPAFRNSLFVAISGYAQESDRERSLAAGFDHHSAKPVDLTALLAVIHTKCPEPQP